MSRRPALSAAILATGITATVPALAQTTGPTSPSTPAPAAAAPSTPPATATVTLPAPGMDGPLALNTSPFSIDLGPAGKTYISGVVSGLGLVQNNPLPGDRNGQIDLSNGQLILQKIDGLVQYYVQVGAYSIPALGTAYLTAGHAINDYFGAVPQTFVKLAPTADFSIEAGKLPTLIGAEYTFSFENMNIERGLLWNQEPAVSRGVQVNYTAGPVVLALSLNDGYYSDRFNWISGSAIWTINSANTLTFAVGGNTGRTSLSNLATPLAQNNSSIYNLIYTYNAVPWTITPYLQATHVPKNPAIGIAHDAETLGAAVLANYAFNSNYSLAGRVEYIASTGNLSNGSPNLLYGPGSKAVSLTLTPTYQYNRFFARAEFSFVKTFDSTAGFALGPNLGSTNQVRGLLETGVLF
jgi:putative OmpL-like beta-barrel porin-2